MWEKTLQILSGNRQIKTKELVPEISFLTYLVYYETNYGYTMKVGT